MRAARLREHGHEQARGERAGDPDGAPHDGVAPRPTAGQLPFWASLNGPSFQVSRAIVRWPRDDGW